MWWEWTLEACPCDQCLICSFSSKLYSVPVIVTETCTLARTSLDIFDQASLNNEELMITRYSCHFKTKNAICSQENVAIRVTCSLFVQWQNNQTMFIGVNINKYKYIINIPVLMHWVSVINQLSIIEKKFVWFYNKKHIKELI